ncbi:MAG: glycosyltransferase family 4 protein [Acidimicrobiia bacterium]
MTPATKVAVNLLWCVPGRVGGSEEYLARQLVGLTEHDHGLDITVFALPGYAAAHPDVADAFRLVESRTDGASRPGRILAEHTWLARRTRSCDLVHHGGGTVPALGGNPVVLTIHDLQYREFPRYFGGMKLRYLRHQMPRAAARASVITVPSEYVRRTVIEAFGRTTDDVIVVRHGVEPALGADATPEDELRSRYALGEGTRVLVFPAITHPHKRHDFLVELMARHWTDDDIRLVLLGGRGLADAALAVLIEQSGIGDRIVRPGRVSSPDRDGLVQMATALVFPSEYEGFGAPVLEAMALGTPVIASDRAALPEVLDGAGLVLPLEPEAWAGALVEVGRRRAELVAAGRRRAARFTAGKSAGDLLGAYRRALRSR